MNQIKIASSCSDDDRQAMLGWLREFNAAHNGEFMRSLSEGAEKEFLLIASDKGQAVGGLMGSTLHHWLKINLMAVSPTFRGLGIGRQLVTEAENIAVARDCRFSYVDTMSFQAPGFYTSLGFDEVGRLADWDSNGHDKIFFSKMLSSIALES